MSGFLNLVSIPKLCLIVFFGFISICHNGSFAQDLKEIKYGPITPPHRTDQAMEDFRDYGLGQFIHWGVYAIAGNEWNGVSARSGAPAAEWIRVWKGPTAPENWKETYDKLYLQFNPTDFDAKKWAKQAKEMGAKYVIFTTKHHDGFALWPTKYSDYNIMNTPYKKDIVKQVVDAYDAEGIDVFLYFSILDWNHPGFMYKTPETDEEKKLFKTFLDFTRNQIFELLENYPQAKGLWFDGTWDESWKSAYEFTYQLEKDIRDKHQDIIIGSRFRNDEYGSRHFDSNAKLLGDYQQGWERKMPENFEMLNGMDWDCVMTIPPNGWGYMKDWSGLYTKSTDDILDLLSRAVSMNGNFVLNFGPDAKGKMHRGENILAAEIRDWMKVNAEAVHGVRHSDLPLSKLGYFAEKGDNTYLTVFNRPVNNVVRIAIPLKSTQVPIEAEVLGTKIKLKFSHANIGMSADKNTYYDIVLPKSFVSEKPFVLKIKMGNPNEKSEKFHDAKT